MHVRHVIGIALLLAAVPLQIYLIKYNQNFINLVSEIVKQLPNAMPNLTIDLTEYVNAAKHYIQSVYDDYFVAPKVHVHEEIDEMDHFRPPHIEFRIGDVILTYKRIVGIIVGWSIDRADLSKEPVYTLLAEKHKELIKEKQNHMIGLEGTEIKHKKISKYFEYFDGLRYKPKAWLQKMYPKD